MLSFIFMLIFVVMHSFYQSEDAKGGGGGAGGEKADIHRQNVLPIIGFFCG